MLTAVKQGFGLMGFYIRFNLSSVMAYRASFLIQTVAMALNNSAFIFFWWILFYNMPDIGGYGFVDVMHIWALASASFGVSNVFFGNTRFITQMILMGELDTYLLQPKDPLMNMICGKSSLSAWGDMVYGLVLIAVVTGFSLPRIAVFCLLAITGGLMMTAVMVTIQSLSFYAGNMESFAGLMSEFMITFSIYPEGIFGDLLRWVLYFVVPIGFIAYIPGQVIATLNLWWLPVIMVVLVVWIVIAYSVFYGGLKRYESGNLMVTKV
jgi:ABC-2 type transport system permease protein